MFVPIRSCLALLDECGGVTLPNVTQFDRSALGLKFPFMGEEAT